MPPRHGAVFGDGIDVGTNPHAFSSYGNVGIVLLYLPGCVRQIASYDSVLTFHPDGKDTNDTIRGNKLMENESEGNTTFPKSPYFDEIVLQKREQALPLFVFRATLVNNAELLFEFHQQLQKLVDTALNGSRTTLVRRIYPSYDDIYFQHKFRARWTKSRKVVIPPVIPPIEIVQCSGPGQHRNSASCTTLLKPPAFDCPICLEPLNQDRTPVVLAIDKCGHAFHLG